MSDTYTSYQEDLDNLKSFQNIHGGFVYESGTGICSWSAEAMTPKELEEHWDYIEKYQMNIEEPDPEDYEPYYTLGAPRIGAW